MPEENLPRGRAVLTVLFAGAAVLCLGGTLEYATGSPAATGGAARTYWATLFGFHGLAFGGAALIGGLPLLAVRPAKVLWVAVLSILYGLAFALWFRQQPQALPAALTPWALKLPAFLPAAPAILSGLLWTDDPRPAGGTRTPPRK